MLPPKALADGTRRVLREVGGHALADDTRRVLREGATTKRGNLWFGGHALAGDNAPAGGNTIGDETRQLMDFHTQDVVSTLRMLRSNDIASDAAAERIVRTIFEILADCLSAGHRVTITRFGTFHTKQTAERTARNPATGETIHVPAKLRARFRAGKHLRQSLGDHSAEETEEAAS